MANVDQHLFVVEFVLAVAVKVSVVVAVAVAVNENANVIDSDAVAPRHLRRATREVNDQMARPKM
jgi:hypothetical protein